MTRGRKPAALSVLSGSFGERPDPPADLTDRQAEIWKETVASEPVEFFATAATRAILADYCRHRESAETVSKAIEAFLPEWLKSEDGAKTYASLLRMRALETRTSVTMAMKLRLTNQSRMTKGPAATAGRNASKGARPWES